MKQLALIKALNPGEDDSDDVDSAPAAAAPSTRATPSAPEEAVADDVESESDKLVKRIGSMSLTEIKKGNAGIKLSKYSTESKKSKPKIKSDLAHELK